MWPSEVKESNVSPRDISHIDNPAKPDSPVSPLTLLAPSNYFPIPQRLSTIIEQASREVSRVRPTLAVKFNEKVFVDLASDKPLKEPQLRSKRSFSPPASPTRFLHHVSFDNFAGGEPTAKNTISFTLNVKHKGYQYEKRSRTFMVGVDENAYSDIALQWTIDELVDDGDEIICLRVIDKDAKLISDRNLEKRQYQKEARALLQQIQLKNYDNRAISIVLEFAVGKLHDTFQQMIQLYEPAMLIVGTRGRSLGGFQGLVSNRNSFSKWCLQYSPIPVVVVRPTEKRIKKKAKRDQDPARKEYARILKDSGVSTHETEIWSETTIFEPANDADQEAHLVASALNLPSQFDPTVKHIDIKKLRRYSRTTPFGQPPSNARRPSSPRAPTSKRRESPPPAESPPVSEVESSESGEDDDGEFEVTDGRALLGNKGKGIDEEEERRRRLHQMEMDEAEALAGKKRRQASEGSVDGDGLEKDGREDVHEVEVGIRSNGKGKEPEHGPDGQAESAAAPRTMSDPTVKAVVEPEQARRDTQ